MANSFSLTRKTEMDKGPVSLRQVDEEICGHFNVPHTNDYYHSWFDAIGFELAAGRSFADIIRRCHEDMEASPQRYRYYERELEIAEYLDKHFFSDRWSWEIRTMKEFFENKRKDGDDVFIERISELSLLLDTVFKKHPSLRERYAESLKERFEKLTK